MHLFVKRADGATSGLRVAPSTTVDELRAMAGIDAQWHLTTASVLLAEGCATLENYGVMADSTVYALAPVDGGKKKKKKKKIFKGPKKHAHKHKKVTMRVLKFYKVDTSSGEPKVTHLRTECPHPDCGAGVFMAQHKDRQTCGKCSLTYVAQKK